MTTLLFYKKPVAIDRQAHRDLRLNPLANGFSYAAVTNSVPLTLAELPNACLEYPIVFMLDDQDGGVPIALLGLRDHENLYVTEDRRWDAAYIPAFVRRYPFVLHQPPEGQNPIVLIDEECAGFGAPDGERLFAEDGSESPMLTHMLEFLHHFQEQEKYTHAFVARLRKLDLLVERSVEIKGPEGAAFTLQGFHAVDQERLAALDDAALLGLARSGDLAQIHAHLLSSANMHKLLRRLEPRMAAAQAA